MTGVQTCALPILVTGHAAPGVDAVGVDDLVEILEGVKIGRASCRERV